MNLYRRLLLLALYDTLTPWRVWLGFWRIGRQRPLVNRVIAATVRTPLAIRSAWRFAAKYAPLKK